MGVPTPGSWMKSGSIPSLSSPTEKAPAASKPAKKRTRQGGSTYRASSENTDRSPQKSQGAEHSYSQDEVDAHEKALALKKRIDKKPFVRKPHLTDRPLKDNEKLEALKKELQGTHIRGRQGGKTAKQREFEKITKSATYGKNQEKK